jgi:hypothetical protein
MTSLVLTFACIAAVEGELVNVPRSDSGGQGDAASATASLSSLVSLGRSTSLSPPTRPCAELDVINVSSCFGYSETDNTDFLQAAIDTGAKKIIIANLGPGRNRWIAQTIQLRKPNQTIFFEDGVVLEAMRGAFKSTGNGFLMGQHRLPGLTLSGYGATVRMWREDYANKSLYNHSENRHAFQCISCANLTVMGLTFRESGGDGLCLGGGGMSNLHIKDVISDSNFRQGMTLDGAQGALIENTVFSNTRGTNPQSGVDMEPDLAGDTLENILFRNCTAFNNSGKGFEISAWPLKNSSVTVTWENCTVMNAHNWAFMFNIPNANNSGLINLTNVFIGNSSTSALEFYNKPLVGPDVIVDQLTIDGINDDRSHPIEFSSSTLKHGTQGGVSVTNSTIIDDIDRPFATHDSTALANVSLDVTVINSKGPQLGCTAKLGQNETNVKLKVRCNPERGSSSKLAKLVYNVT